MKLLPLITLLMAATPVFAAEPLTIPAVKTFSLGDTTGNGEGAPDGSVVSKVMFGDGAKNQAFRGFIVFDIEDFRAKLEKAEKVSLRFVVMKKNGESPQNVRIEVIAALDRKEIFPYLFATKPAANLVTDPVLQTLPPINEATDVDVTFPAQQAAAGPQRYLYIRLSPADFTVTANSSSDLVQVFPEEGDDPDLAPVLIVE